MTRKGGTYKSVDEHVALMKAIQAGAEKAFGHHLEAGGAVTVDEANTIRLSILEAGFVIKRAPKSS